MRIGLSSLPVITLLTVLPSLAAAQGPGEAALRAAFEGTVVVLLIDMPGTSDGVDVRSEGQLNVTQHTERLTRYGAALQASQRVTVTLVKVKKDLIEFQLNGGGYGTFGDDTSTSVDMPGVEKTNREKDLEARVRTETDAQRKKQLQGELDDLRRARERENRRIASERAIAEDAKRRMIAGRRLERGSRFNIRFAGSVPANIAPRDVVRALSDFVDFSPSAVEAAGPSRPEERLRKGLLRADALRLLGSPMASSERREGVLRVESLVFVRGSERITAEFVEDVLIRYTIVVR